ncbi:Imm50 family immunity protein [Mesorhizobium sp.]|uniref:Imm50 family immunity protein n=1 Tax=Mesorhizobium sp. TaxID=1871066 RepID=UPI000FE7AEB6|nr:Imm50 family immunity protein [Mesorhizobium sp.]RWD31469.1 MAG: hypothetical protein EOS34_23465 [Mesorhizobium sp.]RWD76449.1 MAG: hypothetical protein EOS48_30695 [Mesorhizobium sp.]RWE93735.1 MAG: hypothetical protein EOS43_28445 [Mesorhizobium sp.]TIS42268.1 MAG: hypothetical protein E5W95_03240 [Mesorhizobium sp.]TIX75628.1 MAG: hypothetical protein E5V21_22320 [Mesorhizobium sp.]
MWPLRIENPIFLQTIYGHYPDLSSVEVTKAEISLDGPSLHLHFISTRLPTGLPSNADHSTRCIELAFEGVESISVRKFQSHDRSAVRMWDDAGNILLTCEGTVRLSMTCQFMRIIKISGLLQSQ